MNRQPYVAVWIAGLVTMACFEGLHAPRCKTLADCPVDQGYTSCEDGYCFRSSVCNQTAPIPGDGCCPPVEVDRTPDTDCLVLDADLGTGTVLSTPASIPSGALFVAGLALDPSAGTVVNLFKVSLSGQVEGWKRVGPASRAWPALVSRDSDVYVAYRDGVMRYAAADLSERAVIPSRSPAGDLASTQGNPLQVVAWPTEGGGVVLYDESGAFPAWFLDLPKVLSDPPLAADTFLPSVISGSGRRLFLATSGGRLIGVEIGANPLGPTAYSATGLTFLGAPVEWAGRVFVAVADGTLRAWRERDHAFEEMWRVTLGNMASGPLLVDQSGFVVAALRNGDIVKIADRDTRAEVTVLLRFDEGLAGWAPILTSRPRLLAISAGGNAVVSAWADADGTWRKGLRFDFPSTVVTAPALSLGRLLVGMASGHLAGWALQEDLPGNGFPCSGGDAGNSRRVSRPP